MDNVKTVVVGASPNPARYSFIAANMLTEYDQPTVLLGKRAGLIAGKEIITEWPEMISDIHTITLYIGPKHQPPLYSYLLGLKPKRIIFNPGTENQEFSGLANIQGIETIEACTLVMLRTNQY